MDRIAAYEVSYPFELGPPGNKVPFGVIRVAVDTALLRNDITPALRSAALLALVSVGISVLSGGLGQQRVSGSVETHHRAIGSHLER